LGRTGQQIDNGLIDEIKPMEFDFRSWAKVLREPTWYQHLVPEFKKLTTLWETDRSDYERSKEAIYDFFEQSLIEGTVALGSTGKDWDSERLPIDTIIIHHTSNPPGLRRSRLSAIELVRLYAPYYAAPYSERDKEISGKPIYSCHVRDGQPVFYPYHWLVRNNGSVEQLLFDHEIGWHAGNWAVNCRSVAVCFDGDFEDGQPSEAEIMAAVELMKARYPSVGRNHILGHCEINQKVTCPSRFFLSNGVKAGWKQELLSGR
jgi:hypothetical protein